MQNPAKTDIKPGIHITICEDFHICVQKLALVEILSCLLLGSDMERSWHAKILYIFERELREFANLLRFTAKSGVIWYIRFGFYWFFYLFLFCLIHECILDNADCERLAQIVKKIYFKEVVLSVYFVLSVICWLKSQGCNRWVCTQDVRVNSVILSFHMSVRVVDIIFWKKLSFLADILRKDKSWIEISLH